MLSRSKRSLGCRLVNGLADNLQKSVYAQSIVRLVKQINLPRYFVDLRHAGTHETLPSLAVLRKACDQVKQVEIERIRDYDLECFARPWNGSNKTIGSPKATIFKR
jgi:hypothetical protein